MVISLSADVIVPYRYWYIKLLILVCVKLKVFLYFFKQVLSSSVIFMCWKILGD